MIAWAAILILRRDYLETLARHGRLLIEPELLFAGVYNVTMTLPRA